jgi:hypothetical protein
MNSLGMRRSPRFLVLVISLRLSATVVRIGLFAIIHCRRRS